MGVSRIRTLLVYADYTSRLSYYDDWLDAFRAAPRLDCRPLNLCARGAGAALKRELAEADLTVLLHSVNGDTTIYLEPFAPLLADRKGLLLSFVGNEVNLPGSPIAAKRAVLRRCAPDFIATQLLPEAGAYLWGDIARRGVLAIPHALNPAVFRVTRPLAAREVDIGVRAVRYLALLGDDDRNRLHDLFARHVFRPPLKVDVSTERLDRAGWAAFLNTCRGTVSSEAGSWFLERDDATVEAVRAWVSGQSKGRNLVIANDSPLRRLGHKLPWGLRVLAGRLLRGGLVRHENSLHEAAAFPEIYARFFRNRPRPPFYGKCISSRHFDAIGTGTCQILLKGRYNDILVADQHYLALEPDFSNLDDVIERFRDPATRRALTEAARAHILEGHTYALRTEQVIRAVDGTA